MIVVSVALLLLAAFVLSRINWTQLSYAMNVGQAKPIPTETVSTVAEEVSAALLSTEEVTDETPKPTLPLATPTPPASENASTVAVAATSCAEQKKAAKTTYDAAVTAENNKYKANKNKIADKYSAKGMAFSSAQKKAQKTESERHDKALKELEKAYQKEQKKFDC